MINTDTNKSPLFHNERKRLRELTGLCLNRIIWDYASALLNRPVIDVALLDRELHGKFGMYEDRGLSMEDILIANFSPEGKAMIDEMLMPDEFNELEE